MSQKEIGDLLSDETFLHLFFEKPDLEHAASRLRRRSILLVGKENTSKPIEVVLAERLINREKFLASGKKGIRGVIYLFALDKAYLAYRTWKFPSASFTHGPHSGRIDRLDDELIISTHLDKERSSLVRMSWRYLDAFKGDPIFRTCDILLEREGKPDMRGIIEIKPDPSYTHGALHIITIHHFTDIREGPKSVNYAFDGNLYGNFAQE